jgi:hypothetical protein
MFSTINKLYIQYKINKRMDVLIDIMKQEKTFVDINIGNWEKVDLYLTKSKCTMKALRKLNNKLKTYN